MNVVKNIKQLIFILIPYNVNSQFTKQANKTAAGWHLKQSRFNWRRTAMGADVTEYTAFLPGHLEIPERTAIRNRVRIFLSAAWSVILLTIILTFDRFVIQPFVQHHRLKKFGMKSAGVDYRWDSYVRASTSEITNKPWNRLLPVEVSTISCWKQN